MSKLKEWQHKSEEDLSDDEKKIFNDLGLFGDSRRKFLGKLSAASLSIWAASNFKLNALIPAGEEVPPALKALLNELEVKLRINEEDYTLNIDSRTSLLDVLRERLGLTGSKKGCGHGQCGACTVIIDGRRKLSCLTLAATCGDKEITTVEGLADGENLHKVQAAFVKYDGYQCGYCTPGQICSSVALLEEAKRGEASYVTEDFKDIRENIELSEEEIRERMSGNLCRCGAYNNIVMAIQESQTGEDQGTKWSFATAEEMEEAGKAK
ncbi:2Fe-2S iron-sulfur cluster-binding protein [Lewinella sp. IMCC34191]|uniref:2Fe-2S iron-sulfur cluster-binding protein n=1 Tax=Lewinella sp. IMCC34191 TaxID=2259172 RepID=UPI000E282D76|nr:2Fe-2S iron-sulfur cluster-binding protein [Lewinella sp. IMCC34191]